MDSKTSRSRPVFRLLPVLIFMTVLLLGVRASDLIQAAFNSVRLPGVSTLQAQTRTPDPTANAAGTAGSTTGHPQAADAHKADGAKMADAKDAKDPKDNTDGKTSATDSSNEKFGPIEAEAVKRMAEQREALQQRARELDQREALLVVAEKRLDQKVNELEKLRSEIQDALKIADDRQAAQMESLVKIYENMKPKEAARIFEALDQPILLNVVERMKEVKTAAILAAMDPIKAKEVTAALAERRQLPTLPALPPQ